MQRAEADPLVLTAAGEKAVRNRHHWIFSRAVARLPEQENGSIVPLESERGEHLGYGYFNRRCSLCARVVSFDRTPPLEALRQALERALESRRTLLAGRPVRILARHRLATDHPINVFHPETEYLKSLLLEVG